MKGLNEGLLEESTERLRAESHVIETEDPRYVHRLRHFSILSNESLENKYLTPGINGVQDRRFKRVVPFDYTVLEEGSAFILGVDHTPVDSEVVLYSAVRASYHPFKL